MSFTKVIRRLDNLPLLVDHGKKRGKRGVEKLSAREMIVVRGREGICDLYQHHI